MGSDDAILVKAKDRKPTINFHGCIYDDNITWIASISKGNEAVNIPVPHIEFNNMI